MQDSLGAAGDSAGSDVVLAYANQQGLLETSEMASLSSVKLRYFLQCKFYIHAALIHSNIDFSIGYYDEGSVEVCEALFVVVLSKDKLVPSHSRASKQFLTSYRILHSRVAII